MSATWKSPPSPIYETLGQLPIDVVLYGACRNCSHTSRLNLANLETRLGR